MSEQPIRWLILFGCWLLYFVFGLSITGLAPLVSTIIADLELTSSEMGVVLGAWQFVYIFLAIPAGLALHRFGPGRLLMLGAAIIATSGFLRSIAQSHIALMAAVALFGLGGPIISAGVPQTISKWFAGKERGLAMGIYITGPAIAGVVTYSSTHAILMPWFGDDWRAVLRVWAWIAVAVGLVWGTIWFLGRGHAPEPADKPVKVNQTLFDLGQFLEILGSRNVVVLLATGVGIFSIDHGLRNWIPEIIRTAGWTPELAGHLAVVSVVLGIVGALTFPRLAIPHRRLNVLRALFGFSAAGCLLISTGVTLALVTGLALTGLASGAMMTITVLTLIEQDAVGADRSGLAGGLFFSAAEIGGVGGPVMVGLIRDFTGDFRLALWLLAALGCALIALSHCLVTRPE